MLQEVFVSSLKVAKKAHTMELGIYYTLNQALLGDHFGLVKDLEFMMTCYLTIDWWYMLYMY